MVAEVVYEVAMDGKDQLRYTAGPDAKEITADRKAANDATWMVGIKAPAPTGGGIVPHETCLDLATLRTSTSSLPCARTGR